MNPTNHNPDLSRSLARHADQFARRGGSELEIDQVLARAGEIRRGRRMRATIVMAAVVAAIVVPVGIVSVGTNGTNGNEQPGPAAPVRVDESPLTLDGLKQGDQPRIGYASGKVFENGGIGVDLGALTDPVVEVAALQDGVLVSTRSDSGELTATFVNTYGEVIGESRSMDAGFAVSADGNVGVFVQPDGTPVAVQEGGRARYELPQIPRGSGFSPVALLGEDCEPRPENTACTVWVVSHGEKQENWVTGTANDDAVTARPGFRSVADVLDGELVAGITEVNDDLTTCSAVTAFDEDEPAWSTCDHRLLAFSPSGERVLATETVGSGVGDPSMAVLASADGTVELDLDVTEQGHIGRMTWEDDTHVLATVYEDGRWAILRIGLDGSREYAVAPVTGFEDFESPFVLPTR